MVSNLKPLKELVTIKGGKRLPKGEVLQTVENNHPYIRVRDMGNRYIPRRGLEYVPEDVFPKISRYIVKENDVIISIVGTVGLVSIIDKRFHHASQTENCAKLSGLSKEDAKYLYYYLISSSGKQEISTYTVGAVQPKLPLYGLESISVPWFDESKRKAIAHILGSLDDKIELNLQMNETLEAMAQAFFKSWFVDFDPVIDNALEAGNSIPDELFERAEQRKTIKKNDNGDNRVFCSLFPNEFEFSEEVGWIPKGWKLVTLGDFAILGNGKTPPVRNVGNIPVFGSNGKIGDCDESNRDNTIIIGRVGSYCGSLQYYPSKCWITDNAMSAEMPNKDHNVFLFQLLSRDNLNNRRTGSGQPLLNQSILRSIKAVMPSMPVIDEYSRITNDFYRRINQINEANLNLEKFRDTLLPKLMSGEIRIPEAAALVEDA